MTEPRETIRVGSPAGWPQRGAEERGPQRAATHCHPIPLSCSPAHRFVMPSHWENGDTLALCSPTNSLSLSVSCQGLFLTIFSFLTSFSVSVSLSIFSVLQLMERHKKNKLLDVRYSFLCLSLSVCRSLLFLFFLPLLPISDVWRLTQCVLCASVCLYGENECACLCACLVFVRDHG